MKNSTQGFTLIELLIVIAIIGILSAVLIPNLLGARGQARNAAAQACANEIVKQGESYQIANNVYPTKLQLVGAYAPGTACNEATGNARQVTSWAVTTNNENAFAGNVVSLASPTVTFNFSNSAGITRAP